MMKTNKELLQLLLEHIKEAFEFNKMFYDGICLIPAYLDGKGLITTAEYHLLRSYLNIKIKPLLNTNNDQYKHGYAWKPGILPPRIEWLQDQINEL